MVDSISLETGFFVESEAILVVSAGAIATGAGGSGRPLPVRWASIVVVQASISMRQRLRRGFRAVYQLLKNSEIGPNLPQINNSSFY